MKQLLILLLLLPMSEKTVIDFNSSKPNDWMIINDTVMGGRSDASIEITGDSVVFTGTVSLQNNGGFVSYRSPFQKFDFSDYNGIEIKYKSTGRRFSLQLDTNRRWWLPNYKHHFENNSNEWVVARLPFEDFQKYQIGKDTGKKMTSSKLDEVIRVGIILLDKKEGPFELEVDYISLY